MWYIVADLTLTNKNMHIKSLILTFAVAAWFVWPAVTHAAPNTVVGAFDTAGSANDVIVVGSYAYVADAGTGILVLNISNPAAPTLAGSYSTGVTDVSQIDIDDTRLYVAGGTKLTILDIANPVVPQLLGTYTDAGGMSIGNVASAGNYAYITGRLPSNQPTLEVLDVSNPAAPPLVGSLAVSNNADLTVSGNYVYVVGGQTVDIVNVYSTLNPTLTLAGTYTSPTTSTNYLGVQVFGSNAYLNDTITGLTLVSVANPSAPTLTANFPGQYGSGLAISNGYVFLGGYFTGGLIVYDIASTGTPVYVTSISGSGNAYGVTVANDTAYVAAGTSGVELIDVSKPDTIAPIVTPAGDPAPVIMPGGTYTDPGVTVTDNVGGTGTTVTGKVNTGTVGKYILTYTVTDRAGNVTTVKRTVIVGPAVEKLILKNNTYALKVGTKSMLLKPFGTYRGAAFGRRLIVDKKTNPFYVFVSYGAMAKPEFVMYNASGKLVTRQNLAPISAKGLQTEITSNPVTLSVFFAIAPKAPGLTATIFNVSKSGFKSLKTVTAAKGAGTLVMKWLRGYTDEYILATLVKGKTVKPLVWRYNGSKKSFVRDTKFDTTKLVWTKTTVKLK